jgi:hypothetical protein
VDAHEHLVLSRQRARDFPDLEDFGAAGAGDDDCSHALRDQR